MNALTDIDDPATKLKILKSLLSDTLNSPEVIGLIQDHIDSLEAAQEESDLVEETDETSEEDLGALFGDDSSDFGANDFGNTDATGMSSEPSFEQSEESGSSDLPSPADLGVGDFSDSTNPELGLD